MVSNITNSILKKKRRRVSRKNKSSWRKNVDIQDVENFLEDQRLEERLGTCFANKPDSELFVVDTQPSEEIKEINKDNLTAKQKKRLSLNQIPRCLQSLVNTSKVPPPVGEGTHPKQKGLCEETEKKKIKKGIYKKKWEAACKNRELNVMRKQDKKDLRSKVNKDLWNANTNRLISLEPSAEWLTKDTKDINKAMIIPPRPKGKAIKPKPVATPHPGTSYNPSFKDHQDLINQAIQEELRVIKEETHLNKVTSGMFRKVTPSQKMAEDLKELRQGLENIDENSEDEGGEFRAVNPPVVNKKKPRKTKTHIRQEKLIRSKKIAEVAEKRKIGGIYKLKFIQKAISKKEEKDKKLKERRIKRKLENPPLPRINSVTFKEPPPTFAEAKELTGNLRALSSKGGGLSEYFVSLQRRGLVPVSKPKIVRKAKMKRYTLADHKMPWEITEGYAKPSKKNKAGSINQ